jgi:2-amino-4-hydroxy-6-hydroxymethyldihydropteridine diphosphokinase
MGLLIEFKRIEAALGRKPGPRWGPRPADIDLIFYGRVRLRTRHLTIPHPETLKRKFVLMPLAEIHPGAKAWLRRLNDPSQNVKLYV